MQVLRALCARVDAGETCVLATVVGVEGSAPRKDAARLLVTGGGERTGTVGGGEVEERTLAEIAAMLEAREATRSFRLPTRCGGAVTVFLERFAPERRLVVIGGGHVGRALAGAAARGGFRTTIVTPALAADRVPPGVDVVAGDDPAALAAFEAPARTHVVVATGDLDTDVAWAVAALQGEFASVGVIGSANKAAAARRQAAAAGVPPERVHTLRCPVGLDLGAVTPEEIAVAIVAELVMLERRGGVPDEWRRASRG